MKFHPDFPAWNELKFYQKLAIALIHRYKLNDQQTLAFLLLANNVGQQLLTDKPLQPLRMLVTGPGGTGKSRIFAAWSDFHEGMNAKDEFRLTAPTGVVASQIGGCTIHSEAALRVPRSTMKANTAGGHKIRSQLEKRFAPLRTLVVDEIYFMSPENMSILSE
ncbi:hypothetical protein EV359DRAFT_37461, partial [Lentinula novae-zelandiae]